MKLHQQFFRFCIIGTVGFLVDVSILYYLRNAGFDLYSARAFSFVIAVSWSWFGNRFYTFRTPSSSGQQLGGEWAKYLGAMLMGGLVNYGVYAILITAFALFREHPWLGVVFGTGAGLLINFTMARRILFRPANE